MLTAEDHRNLVRFAECLAEHAEPSLTHDDLSMLAEIAAALRAVADAQDRTAAELRDRLAFQIWKDVPYFSTGYSWNLFRDNSSVERTELYHLVDAILSLLAPHVATGAEEGVEKVTLADCPIGLFWSESGELCLKTQYGAESYIVSTGECFWGGTNHTAALRSVLVTPVPEGKISTSPRAEERAAGRREGIEAVAKKFDERSAALKALGLLGLDTDAMAASVARALLDTPVNTEAKLQAAADEARAGAAEHIRDVASLSHQIHDLQEGYKHAAELVESLIWLPIRSRAVPASEEKSAASDSKGGADAASR